MQIHEITRPLAEGILDVFSPTARAASAAAGLSKQGYGAAGAVPRGGSPIPSDDWKEKLTQVKKNPAVKQYISQLTQGWTKTADTLIKPTQGLTSLDTLQKTIPTLVSAAKKTNNNLTSTQIGQILSKSAPTVWNNTADKSVAIAQLKNELTKQGVMVDRASVAVAPSKPSTKYSYGKPGQMSSTVAASTPGQTMQKVFGQPKGGIQGMQSDLNEATSMGPAADQYQTAFVKWSDSQLASRDPVTYQAITMQDVRRLPGLATELDRALQAVVSARDTPQSVATVTQYLELAVAGMQARSQQLKNKAPQVSVDATSAADQNLGTVQQTLAKVGVNPRALATFASNSKQKAVVTTGNAEADALLKQAGFRL